MRKRKVIIMASLSAVLSISIAAVCMATVLKPDKEWYQTEEQAIQGEVYEYPKNTNDEYRSIEEAYRQYQIPEDQLAEMSTEALADACLSFPLFPVMYASNESLEAGLQDVWNSFNGLQELEKREDAGRVLLKIYQQINHDEMTHSDDSEYSLRLRYLEMILSDNRILDKLSKDERGELTSCAQKYIEVREKEYQDTFSPMPAVRLTAAVAERDNTKYIDFAKEHEDIADFLSGDESVEVREEEYEQALDILGIK